MPIEDVIEQMKKNVQILPVASPTATTDHIPAFAVTFSYGNRLLAQRVVQEAQETDADVIVVASHGHSGLGTLLLGSVAESVLQVADRPVLVVPVGR